MTSNCVWPISTSFEPASITVTSGDDAVFHETISVAADAPGGTYACEDWAQIDGDPEPPDANANVANFEGTARVKIGTGAWDDSCTFQAEAHDHSEPNVADQFGISYRCDVHGDFIYDLAQLDQGNFQIHSGVKD